MQIHFERDKLYRASLEEFAGLVAELAGEGPVRLVAIDGCGGAGKSTLARGLAVHLSANLIQIDDFYLPNASRAEGSERYGSLFDLKRLCTAVLLPLREGRSVAYERYDWDTDTLAGPIQLPGAGFFIVEGVYSASAELARFYDVRIWVDCPYDVRLARGLERDGEEARDTWTEVWMPQEQAYVDQEGPRKRADLLVDGSSSFHNQVDFRWQLNDEQGKPR
jgi:uridine kinase